MDISESLSTMKSPAYKDFMSSLLPTISKDAILGVPTPFLRRYAKGLKGTPASRTFLASLPHQYYEENNLHAFLIEDIEDFNETISAVNAFLPYVDNWATCDGMCPRVFKTHLEDLLPYIKRWHASEHVYTIRYGLVLLTKLYLDSAFKEEYLAAASIKSDEYYVRMGQAWLLATALAKQPDATFRYLAEAPLSEWVFKKAIQKAIESRRVSSAMKARIKTLQRKDFNYGSSNS